MTYNMNQVFFGKEGLTSTSANHVANMAKEYAERIGQDVKTLRLFTQKARLLSDNTEALLQLPLDCLDEIPNAIRDISKCNALIGWLREAIAERDKCKKETMNCTFFQWAQNNNVIVPVPPELPKEVGDLVSVGQEILNVKQNARYIELKTKLAVYGKFIHPEGLLPKALKEMEHYKANPTKIDGTGRDMVIYSYDVSSTDISRLNNLFFDLQRVYRALQAELNGIEHSFRIESEKEYTKRLSEYKVQYAIYEDCCKTYKAKMASLREQYKEWQMKKADEFNQLRIIIPDYLHDIFVKVNSL